MKKIFKIIGWIVLALLLLVMGGALYVYIKLDSTTLTRDMRELLTEVLGTDVQLKRCSLNPLTQEMAVYGLNIKDRKKVDMLHIDTLELQVNVLELLDNRVMVYGVNLSGAHGIFYKVKKDTAANYQFAVDALTFVTKSGKTVEAPISKKEKRSLMIDLRKCRIENTSVRWDVMSEEFLNTKTWNEYDYNHIYVDKVRLNMKFQGGGSPGSFVGRLKHFSAMERNSLTEIEINDVDFNGMKQSLKLGDAKFKYQDKELEVKGLKVAGRSSSGAELLRTEQKRAEGRTMPGNELLRTGQRHYLSIEKIHFKRDNHKPKKNVGKPNRGEFDAGHLDVELSLKATASYLTADSIALRVNSLTGVDHESGLEVSSLSMDINKARERCYVTNLSLADNSTKIKAKRVNVTLPSKKRQQAFSVSARDVRAHVLLKDIARPFAKKLANFTTPLELSTDLTGSEKGLQFSRIHVYTKDSRLDINATGYINFGSRSKVQGARAKTDLGFNILSMTARRGIKGQILGHFKELSPSLTSTLTRIGDIRFKGKVLIPYRKQIISGKLRTGIGVFNADVTLNNDTHRMSGTVGSDSVDMYKFIGNENIGPVAFTSSFDLDISKHKSKAKDLSSKNKPFPIGTVRGKALRASYKIFKVKNVDFQITSTGKQATGHLNTNNKLIDISADFSCQSSDIKNTLSVKPHINVHNIIENTFLKNTFIGKLFGKKKKKKSKE